MFTLHTLQCLFWPFLFGVRGPWFWWETACIFWCYEKQTLSSGLKRIMTSRQPRGNREDSLTF
jgi:hypothetical protein